jgi:hypothetical protein
MDRRSFLRRFGVGAAAVVAAPSLVKAALPETVEQMTAEEYHISNAKELYDRREWAKRRYPMRMDECYRSQWDDIAEREFFRPHWEELVKRYGENVNILDMLKMTP